MNAFLFAAWPFVNPWMLGWLAAAAAPVVIHLLSRRRYREETWAAMEFLLAAAKKHSRRIRIEQLILLALRTLILLLLALALAEPTFGPLLGGPEGFRGGVTHWVLVLDASYSMDYREEGVATFQKAKEMAAKLANDGKQGDGFTLLLLSDPPVAVIREPAFDASDVARELEVLSLRHGGANLAATLGEVERIIDTARENHQRLRKTEVCVFSDLGRTTWDAADSESARRQVAALSQKATLRLFDLGGEGRENAAISQLRLTEPILTPGRDLTLVGEVQQFQGADSRRRVQFLVDGRRVDDQTVTVGPGKPASVAFTHRFSSAGPHSVELRLDEDLLPLDDRRWLCFQVRQSLSALCVEGRPGAARYVALALDPRRDGAQGVRAEVAPETALLERELSDYDCVFMCNLSGFGREEANVLEAYLRQGGAIVVFLGDQVDAASYNRWLVERGEESPLLPASIGVTRHDTSQYGFDPLQYEHPLVAAFRGHEQAGLLTTPIWKYFELTPLEKLGARTALAFGGQAPAIVEAPVHRGRAIVVATAPSTASRIARDNPSPWTAWPTWPSFPPLVQEMMRLAVEDRMGASNVQVGEPLLGALPGAASTEAVTITGPPRGGTESWSERAPLVLDGDHSLWTFGQTSFAGIYRAEPSELGESQWFAVNVNTSEGELTRADPALLPSQWKRSDPTREEADGQLVDDPQQPYFRHVLVLMALCMVAESVLAWYFGNASA